MTTLTLREWSTAPAVPLSPAQCDALRTVFKAVVQPAPGRDGCYDVSPSGTIGAVRVDDTTIVVTPKIPISRLLFLLGYIADPRFRPEDADVGAVPDVVSAVTRLFTTLTERALQYGVLRGYRTVDADLNTVRGRIDLAEQLRRRPGIDLPLAVSYQEHDEDILENQLLITVANYLRHLGTRDATAQRMLYRVADRLQDVRLIPVAPSAVPTVIWTRLNEHLRPAVELARLILRSQSPDVIGGANQMPGLTIDMAELFETFVRTAMREALGADEDQFPTGHDCPPLHLDAYRRVRLEPDLSYWINGQCTFIGDVKYKQDTGSGLNADLYQLLAYATAADVSDATLVYASGPPTPRTHTVLGANVALHVEHLDVAAEPQVLLQQIAELVDRIPTRRLIAGRDASDISIGSDRRRPAGSHEPHAGRPVRNQSAISPQNASKSPSSSRTHTS